MPACAVKNTARQLRSTIMHNALSLIILAFFLHLYL
jgi:hypothetical protein